jgi:hypothetical protein
VAIQGHIRALVRVDDVDVLRDLLVQNAGVPPDTIAVTRPEPGAYRDAAPDLELHELVDEGRSWLIVAIAVGAVLGALIALVIPALRETTWVTIPLFAFAGAWASGAVVTARRVQVRRREDPLPETVHEVDARERDDLRLLTIDELRDHDRALEVLRVGGAHLLDTQHPRVGRDEPGARPAGRHEDGGGPSL